jgi:hypothetical protein
MTWKQIKAEALRIVDEVAQRKADLELTGYQNKVRYRSNHPAGMTMRDHNAIVCEAMREDFASWHICVRRLVKSRVTRSQFSSCPCLYYLAMQASANACARQISWHKNRVFM